MPSALSIKIGDFLYKNMFPVYNVLYPVFKKRQDRQEIELLTRYVRKGDVVLDIGANIGFYTKILSRLVGEDGKVYAFEPDETNFRYLKKNAGHLKNVEFINKAVSNKTGNIILYKSDLLNVDHKTYATADYSSTTEIGCIAADDAIPNRKVDFIKIDIQGYEYFAFQGMKEIMHQNKNLKILSEFFPYGIKQSGTNIYEFFDLLRNNGYAVYIEKGNRYVPLLPDDLVHYELLPRKFYYNIFTEPNK
jgi:FkbM family methyltransferase